MAKDKLVSAYRKQIERLYTHKVTIKETEMVFNPEKHRSEQQEVTKYENQPCRISFNSQKVDDHDLYTSSQNMAKMFIAPEVIIKDSSKIEANINGQTVNFIKSTEPFLYPTHNEYTLTYETQVN